jgi:hypothetical protein
MKQGEPQTVIRSPNYVMNDWAISNIPTSANHSTIVIEASTVDNYVDLTMPDGERARLLTLAARGVIVEQGLLYSLVIV